MTEEVYSEYEVKESAVKWHGENNAPAEVLGCVGSLEETMNTKVITKKCGDRILKEIVKSDGTGEIKVNLHMKHSAFKKGFGQEFEFLKSGVAAYGRDSIHKRFCFTNKVVDEDGDVMYTAYPNCVIKNGVAHKIENGADTVAEVELTIGVAPDQYGFGRYEILEKDIQNDNEKAKWLKEFTPELTRLQEV